MKVISEAQKRYSEQQLRNSKTRRVLEAAFSPEFAERYMTGLMFDTAGNGKNGSAASDAPEQSRGPTEQPRPASQGARA